MHPRIAKVLLGLIAHAHVVIDYRIEAMDILLRTFQSPKNSSTAGHSPQVAAEFVSFLGNLQNSVKL
jgi:hypothetical protein